MTRPVKATEEQVQQGMKLINEIKPFKVGNTWIRFGLNSIQVEEENIVHVFRVDYGSSYDPNAPFIMDKDSEESLVIREVSSLSNPTWDPEGPEDGGHPY